MFSWQQNTFTSGKVFPFSVWFELVSFIPSEYEKNITTYIITLFILLSFDLMIFITTHIQTQHQVMSGTYSGFPTSPKHGHGNVHFPPQSSVKFSALDSIPLPPPLKRPCCQNHIPSPLKALDSCWTLS